jgi:hypothetical protein
MRSLLAWCGIAAVAVTGTPTHATWYEAKSKHFVIYANESSDDLSKFADRLERFDQAVRFVRGMDDPPVGEGNRLTVFVLPSVGAVQKLMGGDRFIEGFYTGRASGSYAFVPRHTDQNGPGTLTADIIVRQVCSTEASCRSRLFSPAIIRRLPHSSANRSTAAAGFSSTI